MNLSLLILLACILLSEHSRAISWFEGKQKESTATPGQSYEETQEDTARDIYRNATLEKVTLLQYLNDREVKLRQAEEISQLLLRDILDGVSNFRSSATDTQSAIQDLVRKVSAGFDQGALALADAISLLLAHAEHNQMEAISRVDSALGEAIQRHSTSLDLVSTSTQRSFHDHVEEIFAISRRHFADIGDVAGEIYMRLSVVGGELGDMHQAGHNLPYSAPFSFSHGTQSVSQLATSLSALGSQVDSNLAQAQDTHALQVESSEAALDLANSLAELSAAAHHEMQNISGTAEGIRESMLDAAAEALGPDWLAWGRAFALWVCGVILRVDPSSLEHVAALPMVRALIAATRVASWCVRAAASSSVNNIHPECAIARAVREALARQLANASLEPRPRERLCDYSEAWDPQ
ncbi:hypothetical protein EVJ58_g2517 [Rhodofomes roseus]|uniref:Uncharacterized protein n=1 Tax=Rhodofomes roseus TaxID=34475 RepID=A0A4Y9YSB7_9APHY|nr:hypothetical protein EVJ58_g2517 [Rhodofomes roseus]